MNTKLLLSVSAVVMGVCGVAGVFLPDELLAMFGTCQGRVPSLFVQLFAAALFAFAMMNWTARGSLIGGIYNRPVSIANLTHFAIGALSAVKVVLAGESHPWLLAATLVYAVFAVAFGALFFRSPVTQAGGSKPA